MILAGLLFNVISGLVVDKAQNLVGEHVEKMIDDILPDDAREELDKIISDDSEHPFDNVSDALVGAVEGKLPISLKDGKLLPIEVEFKVRFDPNTKSIEIVQS
tara:strand:+ start:730 stop:1038 length:309 start_codon:yes stop_codon:yes gene_type:complete